VLWASVPRNGTTASARARSSSDSRWRIPAMYQRVAPIPGNNQADGAQRGNASV
jgi:hypothetical protein